MVYCRVGNFWERAIFDFLGHPRQYEFEGRSLWDKRMTGPLLFAINSLSLGGTSIGSVFWWIRTISAAERCNSQIERWDAWKWQLVRTFAVGIMLAWITKRSRFRWLAPGIAKMSSSNARKTRTAKVTAGRNAVNEQTANVYLVIHARAAKTENGGEKHALRAERWIS